MARSRLIALLLVPLAFLLMGSKAVLVDPDPVQVPAGVKLQDVAKAIKVGIVRRGWVVTKDEAGQIDATLNVRTHMAKVVIPYNTKEVAIHYAGSDNLDYQEKNGVKYIDSGTNFFMMEVKGMIGAEVGTTMRAKKVQIGRVWSEWPEMVRVTVGTYEEMTKFNAALGMVLKEGPSKVAKAG